jgi:hypothetical protein
MKLNHNLLFLLCLSAVLSVSNLCFASDSLYQYFPRAVLIQLRSEQNRIKTLIKEKRYKVLEEVKKDAIGVRASMMYDFSDHFEFCSVYFFEDTNLNLVLNRKFDGILLNGDGSIAKNLKINDTSTDYLILYYGYPTLQRRREDSVTDQEKYIYKSGEPFGKGLIINNYQYQQISFFYRFGYDNFFRGKKSYGKYAYESKHYDMEYYPFAQKLSDKLFKNSRKIRISHGNENVQ